MCLALAACGGPSGDPDIDFAPPSDDETDLPAAPDPGTVADSLPISYEGECFSTVVVGVEETVDASDLPAIRVYCDFTNNDICSQTPWLSLGLFALQDGAELESTYSSEEMSTYEDNRYSMSVRPGCTVRCGVLFLVDPDGGPITIGLKDEWLDEDPATVSVSLDLENLPGAPAEPFVPAPVTDPQWLAGRSPSGTLYGGEYMEIDGYELTENAEGDRLIRVFFNFTNNSEDVSGLWWATNISVYQDGIELDEGVPTQITDTDALFDADVAIGESCRCSCTWVLISDSPVEVQTGYDEDESGLGAVIDLP